MSLGKGERTVAGICVTLLLGVVYLCFMGKAPKGPSIVLITIDTLRADKLGVYGAPSPASEEFDLLAQKGVVFDKAISQASWTRSSMASMLTGLYPRRTGVVKERWDKLPLEVDTLAEKLKRKGYTTIGLTANPQLNKDFQFEQGFKHYTESNVIFAWMKTTEGKSKAGKDSPIRSGEEMLTESLRLIRHHAGDGPIYLQALLMDVHAHHRIKVDEIDPDLKSFADAAYLQAVRNVMRPLAKFINEADGVLKGDVVFIVNADHGEGLEDHPSVGGSKGHGNLLYRSQVHVPLIFIGGSNYSKLAPGHRGGIVELTDLVPTVLALSGDERTIAGLDGRSQLLALLNNDGLAVGGDSRNAFTETQWRPTVKKAAIISKDWFFIHGEDSWEGTLPEELHPFSAIQDGAKTSVLAENAAVADQLRKLLKDTTSAPLPNTSPS